MKSEPTALLVCDLDNTLYDWVSYFVPSFYAMVDAATAIMGCNRNRLLDDFRKVHQRHHDTEQPFALLETETVRNHYSGLSLIETAEALNPAFHAFNSSRKRTLVLHNGVSETLDVLIANGVKIVAHTESQLFAAMDRLKRLDILKYFSTIYCRERSRISHPDSNAGTRWLKGLSLENVRELSRYQSKPNTDVLNEICLAEGINQDRTAYVGDSVARDMLMAKKAGVFAIWAAYGAEHDEKLYADLVRVSHWTSEDVAKEKLLRIKASQIRPDFIATQSFSEVLTALQVAAMRWEHEVKRAENKHATS